MIIFTLIGELLFFGLLFAAISIGGPWQNFVDIPSLIILFGGIAAMSLMSFSLKEIKQAFHHALGGGGNKDELGLSMFFWECTIRNMFIVGILGTIIGVVQMLNSLSNPDQIGICMAVALLTVFYSFLLNAVFPIPAYYLLKKRIKE